MPFRLGEKYYYMIVKKEGGIAPRGAPERPRPRVFRLGDVGANVEWK